ncbi:MAG TPA: DUF971 domain-containing protein [Burkholderiaceae bacterium]|nr:DUF971 domain-containing protein [Burkholderiaceae bacterium]
MATGSKQTPAAPVPTELTVRMQSRTLETSFDNGQQFSLPFEFLRVYSPSAEVRGHGPGQEVLQTGKREVTLTALEPVGNYAVQPHFSDGHNTGIYSWDYLLWLGSNQEELWEAYLQRLEAAGFTRESGRDKRMPITMAELHRAATAKQERDKHQP